MKRISNLLAALVFVSLVFFISCGNDDGGGSSDPLAEQAAGLVRTWQATTVVNTQSGVVTDQWTNLVLTFTGDANGGSFTTNGGANGFTAVWPTQGQWNFDTSSSSPEDFIVRDDEIRIELTTVEPPVLILAFNVPASATARTSAIAGDWTFTFTESN